MGVSVYAWKNAGFRRLFLRPEFLSREPLRYVRYGGLKDEALGAFRKAGLGIEPEDRAGLPEEEVAELPHFGVVGAELKCQSGPGDLDRPAEIGTAEGEPAVDVQGERGPESSQDPEVDRDRPIDHGLEEVLGELDEAAEEIGLFRLGGRPPQRGAGSDDEAGILEAAGAGVGAADGAREEAPDLVAETGDSSPAATGGDLAKLAHEGGEVSPQLDVTRAGPDGLGRQPAKEDSRALPPREADPGRCQNDEVKVAVGPFENGDAGAGILMGQGSLHEEPGHEAEGAGFECLLAADGQGLAGDAFEIPAAGSLRAVVQLSRPEEGLGARKSTRRTEVSQVQSRGSIQ